MGREWDAFDELLTLVSTLTEEVIMCEIVEETKVKIPVAVMGTMLLAAARGFQNEDPHNVVEMDSEEFTFLSRFVMRGLINFANEPMENWVIDELEHFWKEFDPNDSEPVSTSG